MGAWLARGYGWLGKGQGGALKGQYQSCLQDPSQSSWDTRNTLTLLCPQSVPQHHNTVRALAPTDTMQEQLGLGGEAEVDDIVQHGDVQPPGGHVSDQQHWALALGELGNVDLAGGLVQRAVNVGAADALRRQQLGRGEERLDPTWACALSKETGPETPGWPPGPPNPTVLPPLSERSVEQHLHDHILWDFSFNPVKWRERFQQGPATVADPPWAPPNATYFLQILCVVLGGHKDDGLVLGLHHAAEQVEQHGWFVVPAHMEERQLQHEGSAQPCATTATLVPSSGAGGLQGVRGTKPVKLPPLVSP